MPARSEDGAARRSSQDDPDRLPPVRLPFTVLGGGHASAPAGNERSWGSRLGLWWADSDGSPGVVVTGVRPGAEAATAGIVVGDVIVELGGAPIRSLGDVVRVLDSREPGALNVMVRGGEGSGSRSATLRVPAVEAAPSATPQAAPVAARVPTVDITRSIQSYIECVLCNPIQREVTHPGVAADPEFGCLGADLEFSMQAVGIAAIQNAIAQNEPRVKDLDVTTVEIPVRQEGAVTLRPGIRVRATLAASGEPIEVDLVIQDLTGRRNSNRLRRRAREAGS
jgi:hypothetical protein